MSSSRYPSIEGHLEIGGYESDGFPHVNIHGDPEGLRSFARLLMALAEEDQEAIEGLPDGAQVHVHLDPDVKLSRSSQRTIVGRLDEKGTGRFHPGFEGRKA